MNTQQSTAALQKGGQTFLKASLCSCSSQLHRTFELVSNHLLLVCSDWQQDCSSVIQSSQQKRQAIIFAFFQASLVIASGTGRYEVFGDCSGPPGYHNTLMEKWLNSYMGAGFHNSLMSRSSQLGSLDRPPLKPSRQ